MQVALPKDAPPIGSVLTAFAQPTITAVAPAGKRLNAEGVMAVTLIYLPMDSDIPMAVRSREPFEMTFPMEAADGALTQAHVIEATPGPATSDRAEVRCVVSLHMVKHGVRPTAAIVDVEQRPAARQERGFVLVWPAKGETRWQTAKRLRVAEKEQNPTRKGAVIAIRRRKSDPRTRKRPFCLARKRGGKHRKDKYPHGDETNGYMTVTDKKMRRQKKCYQQQTKKNVKKYH